MFGKKALVLPLMFALALASLSLIPSIHEKPNELRSVLGAALCLIGWNGLLAAAMRQGRKLKLEVVLRKQHYVQACAQGSVLLYWGWYWPQVYSFAPLILAQLLFAYAFDMLLCWSRRETYILGFGPFPVI